MVDFPISNCEPHSLHLMTPYIRWLVIYWMAMLKQMGFDPEKTKRTLDMLLMDRKNEFRELADVIFPKGTSSNMSVEDSNKFILDFSLDVNTAFKTWSGQERLSTNSSLKALTILRQLSRGQAAMISVAHLLNISYDLAEEFKVIYNRLE